LDWGAVDDLITEMGDKGNVLVSIENFEQWHQEDNNSAIQSNDPNLNVRDVGAKRVHWNWDKWDNRGQ